ncbi:MlaD family protein [Emticicia sp. 21SJ11W-3]|uniref:MlaD family protein n=1 Tax=Emticicia sp. 21SJ11W-3 TaxID=2916755 RepID=UPI0020A164C1|nr:MlaD family protein [Emticicia sp. 21SJ11W-3]UTA69267.1 MlaD family protein [Emticicia sp. 21SJ11W-3]
MKKEVKVGLLGIITFAIFYLGFNFLKGLDVFSTENEYYAYYSNVEGLQTSNPVMYNGVTIGRVVEVIPEQDRNRVKVLLAIKRDIMLNDNSVAILADNGLLGGKMIKMLIQAGNPIKDEGVLKSEIEGGLMSGLSEKASPILKNADSLLISLTTVVKQFDQTGVALKALISNADATTTGVNSVVAANAQNLSAVTANAALLTANLNTLTTSLDTQIKPILKKTNTFADSLNAIRMGETLAQLNRSVASMHQILNEINHGKGTIGKLATNDSLYVNLDRTAANLAVLLADLKANPKRYVHFSLFGKKDKEPKK